MQVDGLLGTSSSILRPLAAHVRHGVPVRLWLAVIVMRNIDHVLEVPTDATERRVRFGLLRGGSL